jgi:tetrahydromethanopterin S-methyltransferase subunit G
MSTANTTNLERISLEAHVDLCAMRYQQLDSRLSNLEEKVDDVHREIVAGQKSMSKVLIGTAGTVIAGILSVVVTVILTMA